MRSKGVESRGDRVALARDAGLKRLSFASVLGGALAALGALVVLLEAAAAIAAAAGAHPRLTTDDSAAVWTAGAVAALAFVSWWYGGYVAGRMARRAGASQGLAVFVLGVAVGAAMYGLALAADRRADVIGRLRSLGIPTGRAEWHWPVVICAVAGLAAMLVGALVGGALGERWHSRLLGRALDPEIGPEAEARRRAQADLVRAEELHGESEKRVLRVRPPSRQPVTGSASPVVRSRFGRSRGADTSDVGDAGQGAEPVVARSEAGEPASGDPTGGRGPGAASDRGEA